MADLDGKKENFEVETEIKGLESVPLSDHELFSIETVRELISVAVKRTHLERYTIKFGPNLLEYSLNENELKYPDTLYRNITQAVIVTEFPKVVFILSAKGAHGNYSIIKFKSEKYSERLIDLIAKANPRAHISNKIGHSKKSKPQSKPKSEVEDEKYDKKKEEKSTNKDKNSKKEDKNKKNKTKNPKTKEEEETKGESEHTPVIAQKNNELDDYNAAKISYFDVDCSNLFPITNPSDRIDEDSLCSMDFNAKSEKELFLFSCPKPPPPAKYPGLQEGSPCRIIDSYRKQEKQDVNKDSSQPVYVIELEPPVKHKRRSNSTPPRVPERQNLNVDDCTMYRPRSAARQVREPDSIPELVTVGPTYTGRYGNLGCSFDDVVVYRPRGARSSISSKKKFREGRSQIRQRKKTYKSRSPISPNKKTRKSRSSTPQKIQICVSPLTVR